MGVPPNGVGNGRGDTEGGGYQRLPPPEHSLTVHFDQTHYGPMSGSGEITWDKGVKAVVGEGVSRPEWDAENGSGGGTSGG